MCSRSQDWEIKDPRFELRTERTALTSNGGVLIRPKVTRSPSHGAEDWGGGLGKLPEAGATEPQKGWESTWHGGEGRG